MQKLLAIILTICIALNVSALNARASTRGSNDLAANLRMQPNNFSPDAMPKIEVNENSKLEGKVLVRPIITATLVPPELSAVGDADPTPQATSPNPQNPPVHHNHNVRGVIIIIFLVTAMAVVLGSLAK